MISPFEIALVLWRRKIALLLLFLVGLSLGILVCVYAPRIYETDTLILIKKPNSALVRTYGTNDPAIVHTRILGSQEVIRGALGDVVLDPSLDRSPGALIAKSLDLLRTTLVGPEPSPPNNVLLAAMRNLRIGIEPGGEIIRVSFRYGDPETASTFLNAVIVHYAKRVQELSQWRDSDPLAAREDELIRAYKNAYDELTEFSSRTSVYSSDEQQQLALKRRNDLSASIAETRSEIEDKTAQLATFPEQLSKMKPLAQVLGSNDLVGPVTSGKQRSTGGADDVTSDTPPLLLQKVYQDTVQTVVKLRTELAGLEKKLEQLQREQDNVDAELSSLAQHEAEYNKLEFQVSQTRADAQAYTKWIADQRSSSALPEIQVLQSASPPLRPMFPKPEFIIPFCAFLSVLIGSAIFVAGHFAGVLVRQATPTRPDLVPAEFSPPPPRSWQASVKKLEASPPLKQLGSGSA